MRALQAERNRLDGAQIRRHVFAGKAVSASGTPRQQAVFISQADGQAIEFGFNCILDCIHAKRFARTTIEGPGIFVFERIVEGQHRRTVLHLLELGERCPAHALRGRGRA